MAKSTDGFLFNYIGAEWTTPTKPNTMIRELFGGELRQATLPAYITLSVGGTLVGYWELTPAQFRAVTDQLARQKNSGSL